VHAGRSICRYHHVQWIERDIEHSQHDLDVSVRTRLFYYSMLCIVPLIRELGGQSTPVKLPADAAGGDTTINISTNFYPGAPVYAALADAVLLSTDSVIFYVHRDVLNRSQNCFNALLLPAMVADLTADRQQQPPIIPVPEVSPVLDILLHAIYHLPCTNYLPSLEHCLSAANALPTYGFNLKSMLSPGTHLFTVLSSHAPTSPMAVYAFAGARDLAPLASAASAHLHAFPLSMIDDALAEKMGARYLRRLFFLHLGRIDALKRLLITPPELHPPNPVCGAGETQRMRRAWALGSAYVGWGANPGECWYRAPSLLYGLYLISCVCCC
jgi:hypothetical protein